MVLLRLSICQETRTVATLWYVHFLTFSVSSSCNYFFLYRQKALVKERRTLPTRGLTYGVSMQTTASVNHRLTVCPPSTKHRQQLQGERLLPGSPSALLTSRLDRRQPPRSQGPLPISPPPLLPHLFRLSLHEPICSHCITVARSPASRIWA